MEQLPKEIIILLYRELDCCSRIAFYKTRASFGRMIAERVTPRPIDCWDFFSQAAENGYLDLLKWAVKTQLYQSSLGWQEIITHHAASKGHLDVCKWVHKKGYPLGEYFITVAAKNGYLDIIQWGIEIGKTEPSCRIASYAIEGGQNHILAFLDTHYREDGWRNRACVQALVYGNLDTLIYLVEELKCPGEKEYLLSMARVIKPKQEIIDWLYLL
jgi:hypothetical protein